ncbi:hypothetical protein NHX12_006130 [Muraenolepis orangiensis]|uniref:Kinesin motor domain-containing protein n=1 Tax=Muraenolepis orangiensis TaxID=630683 RepID=A0A9Q0DSQ9_9TELE|nr:hypothetical protein NHX12_006130 [Muraenolepis orangiensis]
MTEDMCKVFVRVRPLNSMEVDGNMSKVVHVVDDRTLLLEEKVRLDVTQRTQNVSDTKDLAFGFNKVFGEDSTQAEIYLKQKDKTASPNAYIWEAKMSLIDLAGLETNAVADQAKETQVKCQQESTTINRSLVTLWAVLNGLAGPKVRAP